MSGGKVTKKKIDLSFLDDVPEKIEYVRPSVRMAKSMYKRIKKIAEEKEMTLSDVCEKILRHYLGEE